MKLYSRVHGCWYKKKTLEFSQNADSRTHLYDQPYLPPHYRSKHLDETAKTEVLLDNDIIDCCHNKSDLRGVGGASEMGVDLLGLMLV